jgi:short-subunit dehydrogenase
MRLNNAVVLITGASSGIGRATAVACARRGAAVLVHGRDPGRTQETARLVGGTALLADLARRPDRHRLVDRALATHGRIDVVVNNAGAGWSGSFDAMAVERPAELVELNLVAPMEISRALLPPMLARRAGAVCFVSSIAGRTGVAGEAVYAGTKSGLDGFAESLRAEAQGSGVTVGLVVPGVVDDTGFFDSRGSPYTRRRPRPVRPGRVAEALVSTIESGRAETWVPGWLRIAPAVRALAPGAYRVLSGRFGEPTRMGKE